MKKILLGGMIAAAALASCTNEEVIEQNDASKISYSVITEGTSRAADIYCPNNMPASFKVSAKQGTANFFEADEVTNNGGTWQSTNTRYWPTSGSLDFYAYANDGGTMVWSTESAPTFADFTVGSDVAAQQDLLYAVATDQTKAANSTVKLNFRHALSQVVFRAKNTDPNLYVEVSGVSVVNVNSKNTFTFPSESTESNVAHGTASGTVPAAQGTWGTASDLTSYSVDFAAQPVKCIKGDSGNTSDVVNLTEYASAADGSHGTETDFGNAMLLLPQTVAKADIVQGSNTIPTTGVYFMVKCKIWNVATPSATGDKAANDVLLYPGVADGASDAEAANILIPVDIDWAQGMKYIYTFVFGNGNGGWNPNGPDPVFVPITFDVTVDEFIPVANQDVTLDTNTNN